MRILRRLIGRFLRSQSYTNHTPTPPLDKSYPVGPCETAKSAASEPASQDIPLRFYAMLSPHTPLAVLLRNGEVASSGDHDPALEGRGHWAPVSSTFRYNTSYYSRSVDRWIQINPADLLKYLKELRRIIEAPLPPGATDLDEAVARAKQLRTLQTTISNDPKRSGRDSQDEPVADYFDYCFEGQIDRALFVTLGALTIPCFKGLTVDHLLYLHEQGYKSFKDIRNAPDHALFALSGIGPKRVKMIRSSLSNFKHLKYSESEPKTNIVAVADQRHTGATGSMPPMSFFLSASTMNAQQRAFYEHVEQKLRHSERVSVGANVGYLYAYLNKVLADELPETILDELEKIKSLYPEEEKLVRQCSEWISDTYAIHGQYKKALQSFPELQISSRSGIPTSKKLSLRSALGSAIEPIEVLTLFGPKVTNFVREELDLVERYIGILLQEQDSHEHVPLLKTWTENSKRDAHGYPFYGGTSLANAYRELPFYWFCVSTFVEEFCREVTRDAENAVRGDKGLPNVGEGWISETRLYYEVKEALPDKKVVHHASPNWLGLQHLDIFLPEDRVAVEYQGAQHDRPVEFFGGVKAFEENVGRDRRKRHLCEQNGVCLIYVREGYALEEVIEAIRTRQCDQDPVP